MSLLLAGIAPHPPLLIPKIGRGDLVKVKRTQAALRELSRQVAIASPETVIIISPPHGHGFRDTPVITAGRELRGDFAAFNAADVQLTARVDGDLAKAVAVAARGRGIEVLQQEEGGDTLDHGISVPLYYLQEAGTGQQCLAITFAFLSYEKLYQFGEAVQEAVNTTGRRAVVVASGDLSHRLIPGAPAGYDPQGREFDERLVEYLRHYRVAEILAMDAQLVAAAGECGLRSFAIMLGCLSGFSVRPQVLSYEGPFGVGYLVALFSPHSIYVQIARHSLEKHLKGHSSLKLPDKFPPRLNRPGAAFVTLKKKGALRGCIGTVQPFQISLAAEIAENALSAALSDSRFPPVTKAELDQLEIGVDVLSDPEKVDGLAELDPRRYGVIVRAHGRSGLLLPDLEGVDTVEQQLDIARHKAGIGGEEPVEIYRFTVDRYK